MRSPRMKGTVDIIRDNLYVYRVCYGHGDDFYIDTYCIEFTTEGKLGYWYISRFESAHYECSELFSKSQHRFRPNKPLGTFFERGGKKNNIFETDSSAIAYIDKWFVK